MMSNKLQTKDLISIGIFTALYYVVLFATAMLGYIPILFVLLPLYLPITTGIPFMLFLTKVKKFGMVTIMSIVLGLLMFVTGHTWLPIVTATVCGILADLILRAGEYKSFKLSVLAYGVFSIWSMGAMLPLWVMRDSYFAYIRRSMGDEYTNAILAMTPNWVAYAIVGAAFVAGIIGAFLGKKVLKKHFERAGIAG